MMKLHTKLDPDSEEFLRPRPRELPEWIERHNEIVETVRQAQPRTVLMGDSISEQWRSAGRQVWESDPSLRGAFTLGVGGDYTRNMIWRSTHGGEIDGISPNEAIILAGTNDSPHASALAVATGVQRIVDAFQAKLPKARIAVLSIIPREQPGDRLRERVEEVNSVLERVDFGPRTTYFDIYDAFLDQSGRLVEGAYVDELHLSLRGYEIFADALRPVLTELRS